MSHLQKDGSLCLVGLLPWVTCLHNLGSTCGGLSDGGVYVVVVSSRTYLLGTKHLKITW
jgi:hypothetical protein